MELKVGKLSFPEGLFSLVGKFLINFFQLHFHPSPQRYLFSWKNDSFQFLVSKVKHEFCLQVSQIPEKTTKSYKNWNFLWFSLTEKYWIMNMSSLSLFFLLFTSSSLILKHWSRNVKKFQNCLTQYLKNWNTFLIQYLRFP